MREIAEALLEVLASGCRGALATVVKATGSTPQRPGARLLLRPDATFVGTVGGGAIEQAVVEALHRARVSGRSEVLVRKLGYDLGMCCGGSMEVFVEPIEAVPCLWLCGAGHVAKATAPLARSVGFDVTVIDDREELNTPERFPGCQLELGDPTDFIRGLTLNRKDWVLVMTHDHKLDQDIFELLIHQTPRYIGLIGSQRKVVMIQERIRAKSGAQVPSESVYAPVGLELGAVGPEEIAVSIVAELIALRRGKSAAHMRVPPNHVDPAT